MVEAALAAGSDAGAPAMLASVQMLAVPEGNWSYPDPARLVADRLGAHGARTVRSDIGVPQETPVGAALDRIRRGALDVALVVGGEAMASRLKVQRAGGTPAETAQPDATPDERWTPQGEFMADAEVQAGIWAPVEQYACIDNALRAAEGRTVAQHQDEIAALWAGFNAVAQANPLADFAEPRTAAFLRAAGPGNRPLAFPYAKWHSTQWSVDQAGALLLCSVGAARDAGVPLDRWVFPHVAVESSHSLSLTRRADIHRWPAMNLLGAAAAGTGGAAVGRDRTDRVLQLLPGRGPGPAARARPDGPCPDRHRRDGVRRWAPQQLHLPGHRRDGAGPAGGSRGVGHGHHGLGSAVQAGPRRLGCAAAGRTCPGGRLRGRGGAGHRHP